MNIFVCESFYGLRDAEDAGGVEGFTLVLMEGNDGKYAC